VLGASACGTSLDSISTRSQITIEKHRIPVIPEFPDMLRRDRNKSVLPIDKAVPNEI
jgi:hypothetical protein